MSPTYRNNVPPALDTLIHEKRVPAMVAVMVHNGGGDAQGSQRGLEYDTVSGVYTDFIETEVLPRIAKDYGVSVHEGSGRPRDDGRQLGRGVRVHDGVVPSRAVSPRALVLRHLREPAVAAEPGVTARRLGIPRDAHPEHPPPSRFASGCTSASATTGYGDEEETWHNWVLANERMAAALKAKGYKYQYVYSQDSGPHRSQR